MCGRLAGCEKMNCPRSNLNRYGHREENDDNFLCYGQPRVQNKTIQV